MPDTKKPLSIQAVVHSNGHPDSGGGELVGGFCRRKYDGVHLITDALELHAGAARSRRDAIVRVSQPLALADVMADLALAPGEAGETSAELRHRLAFRDELAEAFEAAAAKLRRANRV